MAEKETAGKKRRLGDMQLFWRRGVQYGEVDLPFFLIVIALLVMGIVMMFSASYAWAIAEGKEGSYYAVSQMKNAGLGLVLMLFLCMVDYHFFQKKLIAIGAYVLPLILLVMVFIPGIGVTDGGATRWIAIGSFNFQPSETMKIGMVIFYSYVITKNYDNMRYFLRGMLPMLLALLVPAALLIKEPHISATALIVMTCIILIFVGGVNLKQFLLIGIIGAAGALLVVSIMSRNYDYIQKRIQSWVDPFADSQGNTWQTCQSLIAIGSGGLVGQGLGESIQKLGFLPESQNDMIFAIICEELGLFGAVSIILIFLFMIYRFMIIANNAPDLFGALLVVGVMGHIAIQVILNIAVVTNTIPNTGITLPFISYGGTSVLFLLMEMGIVLSVSNQIKLEK